MMTYDEINIAIAEARGMRWDEQDESWMHYCNNLPDYCADLNAMQSAIKTLDYTELLDWHGHNRDIAYRDGTSPELTNASQRAEAFLKAINAWKQ